MFRPRRRAPGIGLLFLLSQLYNIGFNRIPPVTLSFIGINVAVYLQLLDSLPSLGKACVSANHVWYNGDWMRIILAAFYHLDDFHLYYNMASFVWKGMSLEARMGSSKFLYLLAVFTALTNTVLVALDMALANVTEDNSYIYTCAAGFSGVIFALKVLTTYNLPSGVSMVMGMFPVPMRWACWVELIVIQVLVPNASFTGHLAGILVGMMYVKGPLKYIMDAISGAGKYFMLCTSWLKLEHPPPLLENPRAYIQFPPPPLSSIHVGLHSLLPGHSNKPNGRGQGDVQYICIIDQA